MFTGIIEAIGGVHEVEPTAGGMRIAIDAGRLDLTDVKIGDSIAVNGVCLTVATLVTTRLEFDVSHETLFRTTGFALGARVNLEKSLRLADHLGGHLVSGHVDNVGLVAQFDSAGDNRKLAVEAPPELQKYIASKGSIALNGVSLTVNTIDRNTFEVNLIPHTLRSTNLDGLTPGTRVNLEIDIVARYVERMLSLSR